MEKHILEETTGVTQLGEPPSTCLLNTDIVRHRGNLPPAFKEHRLWGQEQSQPERSRGGGGGTPRTDIGGDLDGLFFF